MPTNSLSNVPMSVTTRATSFNFSAEEENRKEVAILNKDFYYGKQEQSLNLVSTEQECVVINLTKPIVKKRSGMLYANAVVREFDGPTASVNFLQAVYEDNDIDWLLQCADLSAELTGSATIMPVADEEMRTGLRLRMYDAGQISPLENEDRPEKLDALSIVKVVDRLQKHREAEVERVLKQQIWTDEAVITYEGEVLVSSDTNELGFIPFANFKGEEVHDQWLGHAPATSVRMLNEDFNQILTDLGFMIKMQAGTPIALSGYPTSESMVIHPGRAIALPLGADATVLGTNPQIMDTLETLKYLEERMYETSSVPKVSVVGGGTANSGRELMIRWFPLLQVFKEKALRWEKYELHLANTILRVAGLEPVDGLSVKYSDQSVLPVTEAEDTLDRDIELGLVTPVDELLRRKPELSVGEAETEVLVNVMFNDLLGLSQSGLQPGAEEGEEGVEDTDEEDMDEDEEDNPKDKEEEDLEEEEEDEEEEDKDKDDKKKEKDKKKKKKKKDEEDED